MTVILREVAESIKTISRESRETHPHPNPPLEGEGASVFFAASREILLLSMRSLR
jgi:hypothetical protein